MKSNNRFLDITMVLLIMITMVFTSSIPGFAQILQPDNPQEEVRTYIPLILSAAQPTTDLTISAIEVTQAVQGLTNHVHLVHGRPTTVRVYARVNETSPKANVSVSLSGSRNGSPLPGSPLSVTASYAYPLTTDPTTLRLDINKSFNFQLPPDWLGGQVILEAKADSANAYWESNEGNNNLTFTADFLAIPSLNVKLIPIVYTSTYEGITYSFSANNIAQQQADIQSALMKIYPVSSANVQVRSSAITFTGDLYYGSEWDRLLNKIANVKATDGSPPSEVYYGLIPVIDASGNSWWYGGYLGLGFVGPPTYGGPRAAIGLGSGYIRSLNYSVEGEVTAAHEIGHNLGRLHAPCGNPADVDLAYPYSGGIIGQFGLSTSTQVIYPPNTYYDIMGYCDNAWVSDYNYGAWMQSQILFGSSSALTNQPHDSLLLSASIDDQGELLIQPSYFVPTLISEPISDTDFQAQFLDINGQVMASHPLPVSMALAKEFSTTSIHASLPLPDSKPASLRILKNGLPVFEQAFAQQTAELTTQKEAPRLTAQVSQETIVLDWNIPGTPAIVRYSIDGGMSWTTLDIENTNGQWTGLLADLPYKNILFQVIPAWSLETLVMDWSPSTLE